MTKFTELQPVPAALTPEIIKLLRGVSILDSLMDEDLACLKGVTELHAAEGELLIRQGEFTRHFFILLSGRVTVAQILPPLNHEAEIVTYTDGSAFGELLLMANIPVNGNVRATRPSHLLLLDEDSFWHLMTTCPQARKAILSNLAFRFQRYQTMTLQQEKMASLGTLAAGLMHELNNPGAAARRAASQLRQNLERMLELGSRLSRTKLDAEQTECLAGLKSRAMTSHKPIRMNSLEQSDAEEELASWMETAQIEGAWKLAPTLAGVGITWHDLECARTEFPLDVLSDCLGWLEALISSMSLVGLVEDSIGRITELVHAVKSYAYEGKGARQSINVNDSIHATLIILAHKMREKEIVVEREFDDSLPALQTELSGLNQVWTNILDNAIDAVGPKGVIHIRTWSEQRPSADQPDRPQIIISIADNGPGIPLEVQPRIFDPFYTTKEVGVGTGLGLGIVARIVEQFGGTIRFSSEPGRTEFFITLPVSR